jgi:UDP-glucuronate 4-epimerase
VEGIVRIADVIPQPDAHWNSSAPDPATSSAPYRLYNIGNHTAVDVMRFIELLEAALGKRAVMNFLPMQPGDLPETYADVEDLSRAIGFAPSTPLEVGIQRFVEWYIAYYGTHSLTHWSAIRS